MFDLQTESRYLQYERDDPATSLPRPDREAAPKSGCRAQGQPWVFLLLPQLEPPPRAALLPVPQEFGEAVERARAEKWGAGDLELLAEEAQGFEWESQGLRGGRPGAVRAGRF